MPVDGHRREEPTVEAGVTGVHGAVATVEVLDHRPSLAQTGADVSSGNATRRWGEVGGRTVLGSAPRSNQPQRSPDPTVRPDRPTRPPDPTRPPEEGREENRRGTAVGAPARSPCSPPSGATGCPRSRIKVLAPNRTMTIGWKAPPATSATRSNLACLDQVNRSTRRGAHLRSDGAGAAGGRLRRHAVPLAGCWSGRCRRPGQRGHRCGVAETVPEAPSGRARRWVAGESVRSARPHDRVGVGVPAIVRFSLRDTTTTYAPST